MHAWVTRCDPVTALLPRRRDDPNRVVRDSAAEPYPLLVPAAYFTQRPLDESVMREILRRQVRQAALVGRLADDMAPGARGFLHREIETDRIIFRSGGYAKEGLTALTKRPGEMPSYFEVVRPCRRHPRSRPLPVAAPGALRGTAEANGNMPQVPAPLCRRLANGPLPDRAVGCADFYFLDVLPRTGDRPPDPPDVEAERPLRPAFVLSDHGHKIMGGPAEN